MSKEGHTATGDAAATTGEESAVAGHTSRSSDTRSGDEHWPGGLGLLLHKLVNVKAVGAEFPQWQADCPLCGNRGKLGVAYKPRRDAAFASDVIVVAYCHACGSTYPHNYTDPEQNYLRHYAEHLCHDLGIELRDVQADNEYYLAFAVGSEPWKGDPGHESEVHDLPDEDDVLGPCTNLLEDPHFAESLDYLVNERGLTQETIARYEIGYRPTVWGPRIAEGAFTIPVRDGTGALVNLRQRVWPEKKLYLGLAGRGSQLYPLPMFGTSRWICEGEFDALLMRQHGFCAVTSTAGTKFKDEWIERFTPRVDVTICFDPEGYETACKLAERFHAAGRPNVFALDLGRAGLGPKEDLTDWFVNYGRTAGDLRRFRESERKRVARKARR